MRIHHQPCAGVSCPVFHHCIKYVYLIYFTKLYKLSCSALKVILANPDLSVSHKPIKKTFGLLAVLLIKRKTYGGCSAALSLLLPSKTFCPGPRGEKTNTVIRCRMNLGHTPAPLCAGCAGMECCCGQC